jgi:hypothetical protein
VSRSAVDMLTAHRGVVQSSDFVWERSLQDECDDGERLKYICIYLRKMYAIQLVQNVIIFMNYLYLAQMLKKERSCNATTPLVLRSLF